MSIYLDAAAEKAAIKALGDDIGFGRIIQLAHQCWDEMLEAKHGITGHSEGWTLASADIIRERRAAAASPESLGVPQDELIPTPASKSADLDAEPSALDDESELARITWLSSEEDGGGPDVGLILGLGDGASLYVGEMSNAELEERGIAHVEGIGWHIALHTHDGFQIVGAVSDSLAAQEMVEQVFSAIRSWKP